MRRVRCYVDFEIPDELVNDEGELTQKGTMDVAMKYSRASDVTMYVMCDEEFYGMGYTDRCTKAYGHESDSHSTTRS